jgi:hypothetical protein
MSSPLIYDLIIGLLFLAATYVGARFGFFKIFLIFLASYVPSVLAKLLVFNLAGKQFLTFLFTRPTLLFSYFDIAMTIVVLVLVIWIIVRMPRAHSVSSRASGALFAMVLVGFVAVIGSPITDIHLDLQEVRAKSLSGPVIFALGDRLIAQLPDNPDGFFRKPAKAEQQ